MAEKGLGYPALANRVSVTAGLTADQKMKYVEACALQRVKMAPEGMVRKSANDSGSGTPGLSVYHLSSVHLRASVKRCL